MFFIIKKKTAYEMRISDWSSDVCSSDLEGPAGDWWSVYHGYEAGYWTLGRQTLLDPVEWTDNGWFSVRGGDLSQPLAKPAGGTAGPHGHIGRASATD